jgi:biopolymer transport protein ExbD
MKYVQLIAIATLILVAQSALAEFTTVTRASEVRLSEFRLPASVNGIASFKPCAACDIKTVSVNAETRYRLNDQLISLPDLRRSLATVSNRDRKTVIVRHHLESNLITQISIRL